MRSAVIEDIVVFRGECARTFLFLYAVLSIYSLPFFYILVVYCDVVLLYITLCMYREHEREMYLLCTGCVLVVYWLCTGCVLVVYLLCTGCVLVVYWLCTCCVLLCVLSREHEREMYLLCTCVLCCVVVVYHPCVCIENTREKCTCCVLVVYLCTVLCCCCILPCVCIENTREKCPISSN